MAEATTNKVRINSVLSPTAPKGKGLPKHWEIKKLGEVCEKITNGANAKQFDENIGFPISRIETIWNQQIDTNRVKYIKENGKDFVEKYALKHNDILFSHINSDIHLGKTAVYKSVPKTLIHGINLLLIRTNNLINPIYFNYYLNFLRARGKFISIAQKSVNQSSINQSKLKNVDIIVPPLPEQQAIVAKIEELLSELENGKQQLQTAQQQLKVYRQSLLKAAFEGKLSEFRRVGLKDDKISDKKNKRNENEILKSDNPKNPNSDKDKLPKGWKWVELGEILESVKNGSGKKPDDEGEKKILRISSVRPYSVDLTDVRYLKNDLSVDYEVAENDLLFTRYNGTKEFVGVCGRVPSLKDKLFYPDKLIRCRPKIKEHYHSKYLQYASNCGFSRNYILSKLKTTAGQTGIAGSEIKQIPIPLAPLKEQQLIVSELESKLTVCDKIEETISQSLQQAETLRQSILKKAFEGKLIKNQVNP